MVDEVDQGVEGRCPSGRSAAPSGLSPSGSQAKPAVTNALPAALPGHWDTPEGRDMAQRYVTQSREDLPKGDMSDLALANAIFMASRQDLDLIHWQGAAKSRIRWLSAQLAAERAETRP